MWREIGGLEFWQDEVLAASRTVVHAFTTRRGGLDWSPVASLEPAGGSGGEAESAARNRQRILGGLGLAGRLLVAAEQVHGAEVAVVDEGSCAAAAGPPGVQAEACAWVVPGADGLITQRQDVCLSLCFADCVPIFVTDTAGRFVGLAHAGWRGLAAGIPAYLVGAVRVAYGVPPADLLVALGPAIGSCCYEVGEEVVASLEAACPGPSEQWLKRGAARPYVDLRAVARAQLLAAGAPAEQVRVDQHCTACDAERFFSHRRDAGRTGRMVALMALMPDRVGGSHGALPDGR